MYKLISNLPKIPIALAGLSLGIITVGNTLSQYINPYWGFIGNSFATIIVFIFIIRNVFHFSVFYQEVIDPITGSFIPTFTMTIMLLAMKLMHFVPFSGKVLWIFAVVTHLITCCIFVTHQLKTFQLKNVLPSWFIPPVGIITACVSGIHIVPELSILLHLFLFFGLFAYLILFPLIIFRLIKIPIPDKLLPTFAVIDAPASLSLLGYLSLYPENSWPLLGLILSWIMLGMNIAVFISLIKINPLRIAFSPIYASFAFPMAVSAAAALAYSRIKPELSSFHIFWHYWGNLELLGAIVIILWLIYKMYFYLRYYYLEMETTK